MTTPSGLTALALLTAGAAFALPPAPAAAVILSVSLCDGQVATVVGTPGADVLLGTPGRDVIAGLGGNDRISGGAGDDTVCGGDGADRLRGDEGDDALFTGNARWIDNRAGSGFRPDRLDGGPGDDTLDIGREPASRSGHGVSGVITFGSTADGAVDGVVVDLAGRSAVGDGTDVVVPRDGLRVVGTPAADVLRGSAFGEELLGQGGADTIHGRAGDDILRADAGEPTPGGQGSDDDRLNGGPGKDLVTGSIGADFLRGGGGLDVVEATGAGPGRIFGGPGDDFLRMTLSRTTGVVIDGNAGRDDVVLDAAERVEIRMNRAAIALGDQTLGTFTLVERVSPADHVALDYYGTPGPDAVYAGRHGRLRAWTFGGADEVWGSHLGDRIDTGAGRDEVRGRGGRDTCLHAEQRSGCELLR